MTRLVGRQRAATAPRRTARFGGGLLGAKALATIVLVSVLAACGRASSDGAVPSSQTGASSDSASATGVPANSAASAQQGGSGPVDAGAAASGAASGAANSPKVSAPAALAAIAPLTLGTAYAGPAKVDGWIRGGSVVDGTGARAVRADVVVDDGKIIYVGGIDSELVAKHVIDATGKLVAPGFIDTHAHGDPLADNGSFLAQGVTTILVGQDGQSPSGDRIKTWAKRVARKRMSLNVGALTGHGTLRSAAGIGGSPHPTAKQLEKLARLVGQDLEAGAFGLSTGLEYAPGRVAPLEELVAMAKPVAEHDGIVMSHMRSEDDDQIEGALDELIAQGKGAGARVHVAHIKVVYGHGAERAEELLARMARARADGVWLTADIYPYTASYTTIGIVFPDWAKSPSRFKRVARERRDELETYLRERIKLRNGPEATLFGTGGFRGKTLAQVATDLGKPFEKVLIDDVGPAGAAAAYFVMDEALQARLLVDPNTMIGSDGSPTSRHPRGYGTFARVVEEFVTKRKALPIEQAVMKMTGLAAVTLRLDRQERGLIRPGWAADLVVFDPAAVHERATFEEPNRSSEGFDCVWVNGVLVREGGKRVKARPGKLLRMTTPGESEKK